MSKKITVINDTMQCSNKVTKNEKRKSNKNERKN